MLQRGGGAGPNQNYPLGVRKINQDLNTAALSFLFGVDKATVSRNTRRVWQMLPQLNLPLDWPEPPRRGHGQNLEQAGRDYPDLLALVEGIEWV